MLEYLKQLPETNKETTKKLLIKKTELADQLYFALIKNPTFQDELLSIWDERKQDKRSTAAISEYKDGRPFENRDHVNKHLESARKWISLKDRQAARDDIHAAKVLFSLIFQIAKRIELPNSITKILNEYETTRNRLVELNAKLVIRFAKEYSHFSGVTFEDLVQEGNLGLMRAIEKYDPSRNVKLSSYASFWIRQFMGRYVKNYGHSIRIPAHVHGDISRLKREREKFRTQHSRNPNPRELAEGSGLSLSQVTHLMNIVDDPISLEGNGYIRDDTGRRLSGARNGGYRDTMRDMISDKEAPSVEQLYESKQRADRVREMINKLSPRDRSIVCMRLGLDGEPGKTYEEIARKHGLSIENARQISIKTIDQLLRRIGRI